MKKIFIIILFIQVGFAQSLDNSFDADGKMSFNVGGSSNAIYDMSLQSDGKIIAVGYVLAGVNYDLAIARFNTDGSLDLSFNTVGYDLVDLGYNNDIAYGVAIQTDGKIVVAGSASNASNEDFVLLRYNTDGSLDNSFDSDGMVVTTFGTSYDMAYDMAIQPDGKIVAAGTAFIDTAFQFAMARYNTNGSLDLTFDGDGKVTTILNNGSEANAITLQPDGKIILAGKTTMPSFQLDFALARYNIDGSLDNSFDGDGKVTTSVTIYSDIAQDMTLQSDGKIVVVGKGTPVGPEQFAVVRYNTNGSLDNSFDSDGMVTTGFGSSWDEARSVVILPDGKILAGGLASVPSQRYATARYNTDGSLDASWGTGGKLTTTFASTASIWSMIIQPDQKILAGGYSGSGSSYLFSIARYGDSPSKGIEDPEINNIVTYPNPFDQNITIQYTLNSPKKMSIELVDIHGKVVAVLLSNQLQETGTYTQNMIVPTNLPAGNYFMVLSSAEGSNVMKVVKK